MITKRPVTFTSDDDNDIHFEGRARPSRMRTDLPASKWTPQRANILDGSGMFHLGPDIQVEQDGRTLNLKEILLFVVGVWAAVTITWFGVAIDWPRVGRELSRVFGL